jgi:hypothetical protein
MPHCSQGLWRPDPLLRLLPIEPQCLAAVSQVERSLPVLCPGPIRKESSMEMQLTGNGQRQGRRAAVDIPVEVAAEGSPTIHGHLRDLSLSGALVATDFALHLHAYIEITINPREKGHSAVRVMARVTRNLEGGVGVEWCEYAPNAVTDLLRSPSF